MLSNVVLIAQQSGIMTHHHGPFYTFLQHTRPVRLSGKLGVEWWEGDRLLGQLLLHLVQLLIEHGVDFNSLTVNCTPDCLIK